jgi:tRNA(Ile)-lysidine synthase
VAIADDAVGEEEANALFSGLEDVPGLLLAVSGGSDSTALLFLVARWVKGLSERGARAPKLITATIDHGLRADSVREAAAVKRVAGDLGVPHRTLRWREAKPKTALQAAAREARYRLLAQEAIRAGYAHIVTAHTLDDQAETVLFRLARGSGLTGLAGMAHISPLPAYAQREVLLLRPLLSMPKARLVATLKAADIAYSEDPSNRDPRFTRARLRALTPDLAREGLDAANLARLARRMRRADVAIEFAVTVAHGALAPGPWLQSGPIDFAAAQFNGLPAEVALRLLGRAIARAGNEGPVELGKLEELYDTLRRSRSPLRRTLAGALISLAADRLRIERAPPRRRPPARR